MSIITVNAVLAGAVALLMVSTLNQMGPRTPRAVMLAMVLIFVGMVGQCIGALGGRWDHFVDTVLYGGLAAFVVACRRFPVDRHKPKWMDGASIAISAGTLLIGLMLT